jgi:hypothetical protein
MNYAYFTINGKYMLDPYVEDLCLHYEVNMTT